MNFFVYGNSFPEALENLEKVLMRSQEANLALTNVKCCMMFNVGIMLGHLISSAGI